MRMGMDGNSGEKDGRSLEHRRARAAYAVGAVIAGRVTQRERTMVEARDAAKVSARLEKAKTGAEGLNKKVLAILEGAANLPVDRKAGVVYPSPLEGRYSVPGDLNKTELEYQRTFAVNGTQPTNREAGAAYLQTPHSTPLTLRLKLPGDEEYRGISANEVRISYAAPAELVGDQFAGDIGTVEAGHTVVTINQRPYAYKSTSNPTSNVPDGQVSFAINAAGNFGGMSVGFNDNDRLTEIDGGEVDVAGFLDQMQNAVFETEQIGRVPDNTSSLL